MSEVMTLEAAVRLRREVRSRSGSVVFTNGCFDLLHLGHVEYLEKAAAMGDCMIVAVNSDRSVRAIKGPDRPVIGEVERCRIVAALRCVDCVVPFDELTPEGLIRELRPDVLAKGGDWPRERVLGGSLVESWGGKVVSIESSVPERSSSHLIDRISSMQSGSSWLAQPGGAAEAMLRHLHDSARALEETGKRLLDRIKEAGDCVVSAFAAGGKVFLCGNGGSALAAQHVAAELVGRFRDDALALPAIALATDIGVVTAVANDFGYDEVFARQIRALAGPRDVLLAFSTSGMSRNVIRAIEEAKGRNMTTVGLTGRSGGRLGDLADVPLRVPSDVVSHIQEVHLALGHILCEFVESQRHSPRGGETLRDGQAPQRH